MKYWENIANENHWIEDQIEAQLRDTSDELQWLKDIVLENGILHGDIENGTNIERKQITLDHAINILKNVADKSWDEIYGSNSAWVVFALQIVLTHIKTKTWYEWLPEITITGNYDEKMLALVEKFQELANFTDEEQDGKAGPQTITKILELVEDDWWDRDADNESLRRGNKEFKIRRIKEEIDWFENADWEQVGDLQITADNELQFAQMAFYTLKKINEALSRPLWTNESFFVFYIDDKRFDISRWIDWKRKEWNRDMSVIKSWLSVKEAEKLVNFLNDRSAYEAKKSENDVNTENWMPIDTSTTTIEETIDEPREKFEYNDEGTLVKKTVTDTDWSIIVYENTDTSNNKREKKTVKKSDWTISVYEDTDPSSDIREKKLIHKSDWTTIVYEDTEPSNNRREKKTVTDTKWATTKYERNPETEKYEEIVITEEERKLEQLKTEIETLDTHNLIDYENHKVAWATLEFNEQDETVFLENAKYLVNLINQAIESSSWFVY